MAAATVLPLRAAVVVAPTFEEMVREAREIYVAEAVGSRAAWRSSAQGRFIETTVTFRVDAVVKGAFTRERSLSFLGGQIGDMRLDVSDQAQFDRGDRDVLFVSAAGGEVSPLVGFNHGRFRIASGDMILSHDGQPVGVEVGRSRGPATLFEVPSSQGVTLNAFLAHIRATASAAGVNLR
jgi:hypothetical protein